MAGPHLSPREESILLVDDADGRMTALAERVRGLGFRVVRAKTPEQAFRAPPEARPPIGAVLLPPQLAVVDFPAAIAALPARSDGSRPECVLVGQRPHPDDLETFRDAAVHLALWEPFADTVLRFQLNRALATTQPGSRRVETRVPTDLPARIFSAGRRKDAMAYTLSARGAYLETPRPSMPGASIALEIPLGPESLRVGGRVVFTNVPGNLKKENLPTGMGIEFTSIPTLADQTIRRYVAETALALVV
jgi:CheY-like chemotaxis protein